MYTYNRTAANDSLNSAMLVWAQGLVRAMEARFTGYGGWTDHRVSTDIGVSNDHADLLMQGTARNLSGVEQRWSSEILVYPAEFRVTVRFNWVKPDEDILEMLQRVDPTETFKIDPNAPQDKAVMAVSLWLSKNLSPFTDRK